MGCVLKNLVQKAGTGSNRLVGADVSNDAARLPLLSKNRECSVDRPDVQEAPCTCCTGPASLWKLLLTVQCFTHALYIEGRATVLMHSAVLGEWFHLPNCSRSRSTFV